MLLGQCKEVAATLLQREAHHLRRQRGVPRARVQPEQLGRRQGAA